MAKKAIYSKTHPDYMLRLRINGKEYDAEGHESTHFSGVPEGKFDYYARHGECDWTEITSVKKHKGLTCNFWGTIVTCDPIDFGVDDEADVEIIHKTTT